MQALSICAAQWYKSLKHSPLWKTLVETRHVGRVEAFNRHYIPAAVYCRPTGVLRNSFFFSIQYVVVQGIFIWLDSSSSRLGLFCGHGPLSLPPSSRCPQFAPPFSSACKSGAGRGVPARRDGPCLLGPQWGLSKQRSWGLCLFDVVISWTEREKFHPPSFLPVLLPCMVWGLLHATAFSEGLWTSCFCSSFPGESHGCFRLQENVLGKSR